MSAYGYEIVQTLIVDIEPDVHVKRAMNEINAGKVFAELISTKMRKRAKRLQMYYLIFINPYFLHRI